MTERLTVSARLDELMRVRTWLVTHLATAGVTDPARIDLELAVSEAVANVIRHTHAGRRGSIEVTVEVDDDQLTIVIVDDGPAWDGSVSGRPAGDESGGYGVPLIEEIMDTVEHEPLHPAGNRLTLTKLLGA